MRNEIENAKQALEKAINACDPTGLAEVQGIIIKRSEAMIILDILKGRESRWTTAPHKKSRFCDSCGYDEPYKFADEEAIIYNYCPHCGSRMTN